MDHGPMGDEGAPARLQDCRIAGLRDCRIAGLQILTGREPSLQVLPASLKVAGGPDRHSCEVPAPRNPVHEVIAGSHCESQVR